MLPFDTTDDRDSCMLVATIDATQRKAPSCALYAVGSWALVLCLIEPQCLFEARVQGHLVV